MEIDTTTMSVAQVVGVIIEHAGDLTGVVTGDVTGENRTRHEADA